MVRRDRSTTAAVCSIIRSRPKRIRRSGSRTSLDVKGSFVMKKVWMFEGINSSSSNAFGDDEDQLSDRDTGRDESCVNHTWSLYTNLSCSQHCAKCTKRILPHRASYKCTACKQLCHLKCAIKTEDTVQAVSQKEDNIEMDMDDFVTVRENGHVPKRHSQTRNVARLRKQLQEEDVLNTTEVSEKKSDPNNTSIQSQAKLKFSSMKHNIVKRCKSIKKKVGKKSKATSEQVDDNNNNDQDVEERIEEEREAWVRSPVRTRLRSRREQLSERRSETHSQQDELYAQQTNNITSRRRRLTLNKRRPRARGFLHEYELTIGHIRDRLDCVEEKINQLETTIPTELGKWRDLNKKYREDSFSQFESLPVHSIESERAISHQTCVKQLEAENNLPSVSSGTASDEIYLVKERSSSSNEYTEPFTDGVHDGVNKHEGQPPPYGFIYQEDDSLPSGIPARFIPGNTDEVTKHQTSTPVTDRDLAYLKSSGKHGTHFLKHTSVMSFKLDTSLRETRRESCEQDLQTEAESKCDTKQTVLSPEQKAVKHFLRQRSQSDKQHSRSMDKCNLSSSSPMASSTFRCGDESMLGSQTSPFSFTFRNDLVDCKEVSYTKMLDESKGHTRNSSHQNCSDNLSFTFRNDSQMVPTNDDEDLPGYTRNHSFHTYGVDDDYEGVVDEEREMVHEDMCMVEAPVQYTEVQVHERPESSILTDRTSLTNVTRPTGDFINSFDEKPSKGRWVNRDVQMFHYSQPQHTEGLVNSTPIGTGKMDEKGDNGKPPLSHRSDMERNFLLEAGEKLKSFKLRRNSCNSDTITVGVCMEKERFSEGETSNDECAVQEIFVKETVSERQLCMSANIDRRLDEIEHQARSRNTTQEFEKMERMCQDDSNVLSQRNKTLLSQIESQIIMDTDSKGKNSVSRTSSMESKSSAKYHFLHDKGMIKIDSPSLTLVSASPEKHRKEYYRTRTFEDEITDILESGSESGTDDVLIDNDFRLNRPDRQVSTDDLESVETHSKTADTMSATDDTDSHVRAEEQMLDHYLRTVDEGQETWDNVMKWMHKECDDAEGEELEAELRLMMEQGEGSDGRQSEGSDGRQEDVLTLSDHNQEDSIYYSFQTQSGDIRQMIAQDCEGANLMGGNENYNRNGIFNGNEESGDEDEDSLTSASLMYTIMYGTVDDVEKLLNSDTTIAESEIKEGLLWALNHKHLQITLLLLEDICKLIRAAEEEGFVDVYAGYSVKDQWDPVFIVLSKNHPGVVWDTFMGLPVYRRKHDTVSTESYIVENHSLVKATPLSESDSRVISEVIKHADLNKYHSRITKVEGSAFRSKQEGKELVKQTCIAIHCLLKGFIPFGEEPFPKEIEGIPTDVRETFYNTDMYSEQTKSSPSKSDTNNNKALSRVYNKQNGHLNTPNIQNGFIKKVEKGFINKSVYRVDNSVPIASETMNGHAVRLRDTVSVNGVDNSVPKVSESMNGHAVRETIKATGDVDTHSRATSGDNCSVTSSRGTVDNILHEVISYEDNGFKEDENGGTASSTVSAEDFDNGQTTPIFDDGALAMGQTPPIVPEDDLQNCFHDVHMEQTE